MIRSMYGFIGTYGLWVLFGYSYPFARLANNVFDTGPKMWYTRNRIE
jgi:hypothetical protein